MCSELEKSRKDVDVLHGKREGGTRVAGTAPVRFIPQSRGHTVHFAAGLGPPEALVSTKRRLRRWNGIQLDTILPENVSCNPYFCTVCWEGFSTLQST